MVYLLLADAVVVVHLLFIVFVLLGALLILRWRRWVWLHVPAVAWGMSVEFMHLYCPLTPFENSLRAKAGAAGYEGDFVGHYLIPLIYPTGLTPEIQIVLGAIVLAVNLVVYSILIVRWQRARGAR